MIRNKGNHISYLCPQTSDLLHFSKHLKCNLPLKHEPQLPLQVWPQVNLV